MPEHTKQFERVKRYLDRITQIYQGTYLPGSSDQYEDEIVSFFIHCYHLGDWIQHLSRIKITKDEINAFINTHDELKVCADFCNGEKHCRLERKKRTGSQPHIAYSEYRVNHYTEESGIPSTYKASYKIVSGHQIYDALDVAEKCVELWEMFISRLQTDTSQAGKGDA